jgi:hypothetical protein
MGQVERGVVRGSNDQAPRGDHRNNGFLPLSGGPATVHPANMADGGDRRMGSFPLSSGGSPVNPPNADAFRWNPSMVPNTSSGQPGSAVQPGRGDVPVNPFLPGGAAARSLPVADEARAK